MITTGNCNPVAISCSPVQLPVFVPVANWTSIHYLPPPHLFEPDHLSPTSTKSIRAQLLMSHLHHVLSSPIACSTLTMSIQAQLLIFHPHHINLSTTAHLPPPLHQFEPDCLCPTPIVSIQAQSLISLFEPNCSSLTPTASIQA